MSFLDKPVAEMTLAELQRLIRQEVSSQVPPLPAGVASLGDLDVPVVPPDYATQGQVLTYHAPDDTYNVTSPGALSDGTKPLLSPSLAAATAVIGGIGLLNVTWSSSGVSSGDPVGYDVHISSTPGFVPDATTIYGTTMATSMVIKSQANGSSLLYNIPYYVRLIAFDNDGAAAAGVINAGTKISADIGTITAGTLIGATVETAASGQRVVMDSDGLHMYDASTPAILVADLPVDSSKPSYFSGQLLGSAAYGTTLQGLVNSVAQNGKLSLAGGVSQPLTVASLTKGTGGSIPAATYYIAYSWYNGTVETPPSPVSSVAIAASGTVTITVPAAPTMTGTPQARIYMGTATFGAGGANGHLQATTITVSTSAASSVTLSTYSNAGAVSKTTNGFQTTAAGGAVSGGAILAPGFPTDTAGTDYSWRLEGNGRARLVGPIMNVQYWWYSDFLNTSTVLPDGMNESTAAGGGAGNGWAKGTSTNVNPGVIQVVTGTGTTARDIIRTAQDVILTGVARIRFTAYAASGSVPTAGQSYQAIVGLYDSLACSNVGSSGNAIAFGFDSTSTAKLGLWVTKAGTGAFAQAVDSAGANVSWALGVYHLLDFEVNPAGTSIAWWVDGVPQTAVTTNIPVLGMGLSIAIEKTAGATSRAFSVDAMSVYGDFVS